MNCENARSVTLRALTGDATVEEAAAAEAHTAGCAACRAEAAEMEAVWRALGAWQVQAPPDNAEARLLARVDAEERRAPARPRARRLWPAVAAAAVAGVVVGFALPRPTGPRAAPTVVAADRPAYLLLLRRGPDATAPSAGPVFERMVAEYAAWREGLAEQGVLLASDLLDAATGVELRGTASGVAVSEGVPRSASGEYVSGYYLVAAADLSSARELARTSPHLRYGGSIELRPVVVPPAPEVP